ncbi:MAG: hypothetical protein K6F34_01835 [Lachnospiraceae bacterium]|nr:hypothetical protein [Lachnospiraceae bacterium]
MKKSSNNGRSLNIIMLLLVLIFVSLAVILLLTVKTQSDIKGLIADKEEAAVEEEADNGNDANDAPLMIVPQTEAVSDTDPEYPAGQDDPVGSSDTSKPLNVVWLGDSLTQGSLGQDNGNIDNPQAPWRVLADISGYDVEGFGYYGLFAHDILWKWGEEGGEKHPDTVYVFWVGSCDFRDSADNVESVIKDIDTFLQNASLDKYLVLGTTDRHELGGDGAIAVNRRFEERYGKKYLDILAYVEYGPDNLHLTEASYAKVAEAVYEKIRILYDK